MCVCVFGGLGLRRGEKRMNDGEEERRKQKEEAQRRGRMMEGKGGEER